MTTGGKVYFYLTDALGSVVAMADESGAKVNTYKYSPRGVRVLDGTDEKVRQPYQFTGGYRDDTGLYHFAARYYDPNIGRFTSQDPSGQEKNPYLYAEGDPVNRIDPTGLKSCEWWQGPVLCNWDAVNNNVQKGAGAGAAWGVTIGGLGGGLVGGLASGGVGWVPGAITGGGPAAPLADLPADSLVAYGEPLPARNGRPSS